MTRFYRLGRTRWSDVGLVALILIGGSLLPSPLRRRPTFEGFGPDTVLHFLGYAALGATLADALDGEGIGPVRSGLLTIGSSAAIAVGTGRLQRYVPGRAHERSDVAAGILGTAFGVLWWTSTRQDSSPQSSADPEEGNVHHERDRANPSS